MKVELVKRCDEVTRILAARATFSLAQLRGSSSNQIACIGYPKSGTSWMAKLLGGYFAIPEPSFYHVPVLRSAVLHGHRFTGSRVPTVYIVRDPRDVYISLYFHRCRMLIGDKNPRYRTALLSRYEVLPAPFVPEHFSENFFGFVELELESPRDVRIPWNEHVSWSQRQLNVGRSSYVEVLYEDLVANPKGELQRVVEAMEPGSAADSDAMKATVEQNSFEALSGGRQSGETDETSFFRSGSAGGWREMLSDQSLELIAAKCGPQMSRLGYGN